MPEQTETTPLPIDYGQLSQIRVPLDRAGEVFSQKDASGRTPIVLVPVDLNRIHNVYFIAGLVVLVAGIIAGFLLGQWTWPSLGAVLGAGLIAFGIYRSFRVQIPEGTTALLTRGGRHARTLEAGPQVVPPWLVVSHLVTRREIPYDVPAVEALTKDNVTATIDTLVTFVISDPYRFVYSIAPDDFDDILLAACLDAIRAAVRRLTTDGVADLTQQETSSLREGLNAEVEGYGVTIEKINVTDARPPAEFLRSQEDRQLAVYHRAEQAERQTLAQRLQADAEALSRQKAIAQVEREREENQAMVQKAEMGKRIAQLEAEAEDLRLSTMEDRLSRYPQAAAYDLQCAQLEIARALAGNTRAVLQIGAADDILRAYVLRQFLQQDGAGERPAVLPSETPELEVPQEGDGQA